MYKYFYIVFKDIENRNKTTIVYYQDCEVTSISKEEYHRKMKDAEVVFTEKNIIRDNLSAICTNFFSDHNEYLVKYVSYSFFKVGNKIYNKQRKKAMFRLFDWLCNEKNAVNLHLPNIDCF